MKTKRLNNIEFLRIISMYMILVLHYLGYGGFLIEHTSFSINSAIVWFLESLSFVAVNCYVLISGYFLVDAKFKFEKIFKICLQTLFYTLIVYITFLLLNKTDISIISFIKNCLPITSGTYWFATCYIVLYILSPFLNKLIQHLSKEEYKKLLIIIFLLFSVWAMIIPNNNTINYGGSYSISWFICLYLMAGYVKKHVNLEKVKKSKTLFIYLACSIINVLVYFLLPKTDYIKGDVFYNYYSITMVIASISLLLLFLRIEIKNKIANKIIAFAAPTTFGIYLFHENFNVRPYLWGIFNYTKLPSNISSIELLFNILIVPVIIFICMSLIDKIREYIFKYIYKTQLYSIIEKKMRCLNI